MYNCNCDKWYGRKALGDWQKLFCSAPSIPDFVLEVSHVFSCDPHNCLMLVLAFVPVLKEGSWLLGGKSHADCKCYVEFGFGGWCVVIRAWASNYHVRWNLQNEYMLTVGRGEGKIFKGREKSKWVCLETGKRIEDWEKASVADVLRR